MASTHQYIPDPRNDTILVWLDGRLTPRADAMVNVLDSGFMLGDGVWEGIRVHNGRLAFIDQHLRRLYEGAAAIDLDIGMPADQLTDALYETLEANGQADPEADQGVHIRLMVTRGRRSTPYQSPAVVVGDATIVIVPEFKAPKPEVLTRGLNLYTVATRRGRPDVQDPKLNSHSKLNCISACIQAEKAGADEALMLDPHGFVSTCNSTHFFIVTAPQGLNRAQEVWTSTGEYCMPGITRSNVIALCERHGVPVRQKNFSLTDVYAAAEAFVTGTFAGVAPVAEVDGRPMGGVSAAMTGTRPSGGRGPFTEQLQNWYLELIEADTG
ncbi:MAG: aminotransferase class IV [Acidimicrobiales bacterium]|nr:aminotransferase class IV [Acidimicrobiales bacterium]